jgi:hypothetical protein
MAFQNQFTLSLELTNLVPAALSIAGKTWASALSFARQLQSSRSDIVVEEDLALKFGRCRISDNLARSFRTVVEAQNRAEPLQLVDAGITLLCGTGPTVVRAFTESHDGPYFAMVVQCSRHGRAVFAPLFPTPPRCLSSCPFNSKDESAGLQKVFYGILTVSFQALSWLQHI